MGLATVEVEASFLDSPVGGGEGIGVEAGGEFKKLIEQADDGVAAQAGSSCGGDLEIG